MAFPSPGPCAVGGPSVYVLLLLFLLASLLLVAWKDLSLQIQFSFLLTFTCLNFCLCDVGFPSICYEHHWLLKKLVWPDRLDRWEKLN